MLTAHQIRQQFIDFFAERCGHTFVPSSPVVPHEDPTLLFTNAGMNQFKDVFLGVGDRAYKRAVNTQKCIRAGGKHNDLDDVGKDTYHHTFFEMLGNWSFGDYFKKEAIAWAWELLTDVWKLDKSRMHVTVFEGNTEHKLDRDDEALKLWKSVTDIDPSHIHYGDMKDNFWEMGESGPCGPCSEIHIDLTDDKSGADLVNAGDPRVIEIWNLVFIQFNRDARGVLSPLPARHIDTGMGFERICAVLQNRKSNYDTDVFAPIFAAIREVTGAPEYTGRMDKPEDIAYRVIADHIRCLTMAITDGAVPSNEGRGYVLRRILRRAVRYGRQTLGVNEPFFYKLAPAVVDQLGQAFPELTREPGKVADILKEEEELFSRTLDRGIELFEQASKRGGKTITGSDAFELYATYGFPLDLTQLMAEERGMSVDVEGFNEQLEQHREISRAGGSESDARATLLDVVQKSQLHPTEFTGYDELVTDGAKLLMQLALRDEGYVPANDLDPGQHGAIVVDRTPFYAEAGGQVGDSGYIRSREGAVFRVDDTIKVGDIYFHLGELDTGSIHPKTEAFRDDEPLMLEVDADRRQRIMAHHTATHVMNHKLRAILGDHVQQKGSLVDHEKTRFDFSHERAVKDEQVAEIEQLVAADIDADLPVHAGYAPQEEALKVHGLRAVFGEKYPPTVRVVSIGPDVDQLLADPQNEQWYDRSIEFCGGTHVESTGKVEHFAVISEEAVAKGVRRITAVVGPQASKARQTGRALVERMEALDKAKPERLATELAELNEQLTEQPIPLVIRTQLRDGMAELQKRLKAHQKEQGKAAAGQVVDHARHIAEQADGQVIVAHVPDADAQTLRTAMDTVRKLKPDAALLLAAIAGGKVSLVASVPKGLIERGLKAGDWVKQAAQVVGGGGGGRPDMAQAGGRDPDKLDDALAEARRFAESKLD